MPSPSENTNTIVEPTAEMMRQIENDRKDLLTRIRGEVLSTLDPKDWLYDGHPIKGRLLENWPLLDWGSAWVDLGPSIAGNLGPYWHVPLRNEDETVHRLYPKLLQTKWALIAWLAAAEIRDKDAKAKDALLSTYRAALEEARELVRRISEDDYSEEDFRLWCKEPSMIWNALAQAALTTIDLALSDGKSETSTSARQPAAVEQPMNKVDDDG